ncbi:MAG: GNAT family N-acetyltransferase [Hydrogenophaga sp.]
MAHPIASARAASVEGAAVDEHPPGASAAVPIRALGPAHRQRVGAHLLALLPHDRYLRFGYAATDEQIRRYVDGLRFEHDELFGIFNRKLELIAMAHLAYSVDPGCCSCAEFGVSVSHQARGRGYGRQLFERAAMHARNEGVSQLFIHALSENTAMLNIARKAGAIIERDGPEAQAHLRLPPADFDSRVTELIDEQLARTHYQLKWQAKVFRELLSLLQEIRQGVRASRDQVRG